MQRLTFIACICLCMLCAISLPANDQFTTGLEKRSVGNDLDNQQANKSKARTPSTQMFPGPVITDVMRKSQRPFPQPGETVRVEFTAKAGNKDIVPSSALVRYRINSGTQQTLPATHLGGNVYVAEFDAPLADDIVTFSVEVEDEDNIRSLDNTDDYHFRVLDREPVIADVREPFYSNGNSAYDGYIVTLSGIVTVAANSLPNPDLETPLLTIQSADNAHYSGISVMAEGELASYVPGDEVTIIGTVDHLGDVTVLSDIIFTEKTSANNPVRITDVSVYEFSSNGPNGSNTAERYESMLVNVAELGRFNSSSEVEQTGIMISGPLNAGPDAINMRFEIDLRYGTFQNPNTSPPSYAFPDYDQGYSAVQGVIFAAPTETSLIPRTDEDFGEMTITRAADESLASAGIMLKTAPNPSTEFVQVHYELAYATHVVIDVFNMQGTLVASLLNRTLEAGNGTLDFNVRTLPIGNYYVVMKTNGEALTYVMTVAR